MEKASHLRTKSQKNIRDFNVVRMDYMFFEKIDAKEREEGKQRRSGSPVLVICDEEFGIIHAQFVPSKGVNDWSVKMVKQCLEALGSKRLAIRSDQEPAIIALRKEIKRHTHVEIIDENSQAYESQTNGFIENVAKRVQGHYRTIKDSVESRFRSRLSSDHVCLPWLLMFTVQSMNRYLIGNDGKTAHHRCRGRPLKAYMAEFGEKVYYLRLNSKGKEKDKSRWADGTFLGGITESNEVLIGTAGGVIKARDSRRINNVTGRWNRDELDTIKGAP